MNYIGTPIKDHFWYVNYVIFSENFIKSTNNYTYVKYYHISIIDRSNNVYFELKVIVPNTFDVTKFNSLYLQIEGYYPVQNEVQLLTLGAYVTNPVNYGADKKIYTLRYDIQMLPSAYYYFYIDLPAGYEAEATITNDKTNTLGVEDYLGLNNDKINYEGAYLPPSSIVAQMVELTINVTEGSSTETNVWGITTSDVYTRNITLDNDTIVGN